MSSLSVSTILIAAVFVIFIILFIKLLTKPFRFIFKLLINAVFGFIVLFIVDFFGMSIELNLVNALITGFLGVPGILLLALAHWFL